MLNVEIAKDKGFCFGVKRAVEIVEELLSKGEEVYVTGDLIHNEIEMERLRKKGLKSLEVRGEWPDLSGSSVVVRAHGVPLELLKKLHQRAGKVINATCPVVETVADAMKIEENSGFKLYLYGQSGHDEVEYLESVVDELTVIKNEPIEVDSMKIALFSQTTMDIKGFEEVVRRFSENVAKFSVMNVHNTICKVTYHREIEVKELAERNEVCIVVGGRNSSNSKKLHEIAKKFNSNSHFIMDSTELQKNWFKSVKSVGICSGTSTPQRIIEEVVDRLRTFKN